MTAHSRLKALAPVEIEAVDAKLKHQPIEPVLRLWEDLRDAGDMPPMKPEHVRAMAWAIWKAREKLD